MRRTAGVTHITLFTQPADCGGACLFCPRVPDVPHSYLPHSYVARQGLSYDPRQQTRHWLTAVESAGRAAAKLEIIVLGGSFAAHPVDYQEEFLAGVYRAVDHLPDADTSPLDSLIAAHHHGSGHRIVGITVECRPDQVTSELASRLFAAGVTKIEIGVQSLDDDVLAFNNRGHNAETTATATRLIKEAGLKIGFHVILGLPSASQESDDATMTSIFTDPAFQPDHLKIYFCEMFRREFMRPRLVALFESGDWKPMDVDERLARLQYLLPRVPPFIRISRIGRKSAVDEHADRKLVLNRADVERKFSCRCIRCREPKPKRATDANAAAIRIIPLSATERFLEAHPEGHDTCLGVLRLRLSPPRAVVRELHVYGLESIPGASGTHQHRGIGRLLMAAAEQAAQEAGCRELAVSSGVGVRTYYERLGYALCPTGQMVKTL